MSNEIIRVRLNWRVRWKLEWNGRLPPYRNTLTDTNTQNTTTDSILFYFSKNKETLHIILYVCCIAKGYVTDVVSFFFFFFQFVF